MRGLPAQGLPTQTAACAQGIHNSEGVLVRLQGPAPRAPDIGRADEAGDGSNTNPETKGSDRVGCNPDMIAVEDLANAPLAADPIHKEKPARVPQALQNTI